MKYLGTTVIFRRAGDGGYRVFINNIDLGWTWKVKKRWKAIRPDGAIVASNLPLRYDAFQALYAQRFGNPDLRRLMSFKGRAGKNY